MAAAPFPADEPEPEPSTLERANAACELIGGFAGTLAGSPQTPPRAALAAMLYVLQTTVGDLTVMPDAAYLVNGWTNQRYLHPTGSNADLWHQCGRALGARQGAVLVKTAPASQGPARSPGTVSLPSNEATQGSD